MDVVEKGMASILRRALCFVWHNRSSRSGCNHMGGLHKLAHVAIVNGERISRRELIGRLEKAYGEDASEMINEVLLRQAPEAGVSVTAEEVDTEVTA